MRKVATLIAAVGASFALASAASAASITLLGSNLPGTNTYSIVVSWSAAEGVAGIATSITTTGTYTGAFTETFPGTFPLALPGPNVVNGATGIAGSWGAAAFAPNAGPQTITIGTVEVTVAAGQVVNPFFTAADGIAGAGGSVIPTTLEGVTIVPEPATAALLGLGLAGLVVVGRRNRE